MEYILLYLIALKILDLKKLILYSATPSVLTILIVLGLVLPEKY